MLSITRQMWFYSQMLNNFNIFLLEQFLPLSNQHFKFKNAGAFNTLPDKKFQAFTRNAISIYLWGCTSGNIGHYGNFFRLNPNSIFNKGLNV